MQHNSLSLYDYLALANQPALVVLSHRAAFKTPALVTGGTVTISGTNTQELGRIDTAYLGAHYLTLFYSRNRKICTNILRAQQHTQARRVLVMRGQNHVGVLEELPASNPDYRAFFRSNYLKINKSRSLKTAAKRPPLRP